MFEILLSPSTGLKQSVDYTFTLRYPPDLGIAVTDTARLNLRYALDDAQPVDSLTTGNGRLEIAVTQDGTARLTVRLTGEVSGAYPVQRSDGGSRYRKLKAAEAPTITDVSNYRVLPLYGTLIVTSATGEDRQGTALDFILLFEASFTRENP